MKSGERSLISNTLIIFTAAAITKLIGAVLKIPLGNLLGGMGMGYFSTAYSLFSPIFSITAAGIPIVITRLTAKSIAEENYRNASEILKTGLKLAAVLGAIGTAVIMLLAFPFCNIFAGSSESAYAVIAIAPSAFFCCVAAAYRGYYEGRRDMLPTALSQVCEAAVKAAAGLGIAVAVLGAKTAELGSHEAALPYAAAGAILGVTLSEVCGMLCLVIKSRRDKKKAAKNPSRNFHGQKCSTPTSANMLREMLPVAVGALVINLSSLIDLMTITNCIDYSLTQNAAYFLESFTYGGAAGIPIASLGNFIYGSYTGIVSSVFMLVPTLTVMASRSILPSVTAAYECRNVYCLRKNISAAFRATFMLGLPMGLIVALLSKPILTLLYPARTAEIFVSEMPLAILGAGGIFLSLASVLISLFQAIGRADIPIKLMGAAAAIKLILNVALIPVPMLNISGAALSSIASYIVVAFIGILALKRVTGIESLTACIFSLSLSPLLNSLAAGAAAVLLFYFTPSGFILPLRLLLAGMGASAVYLLLTLFCCKKELKSFIARKRGGTK